MTYTVDYGTGPAVLMLHGIGGSSDSFAPQVAGLGDSLRVIAWDAPGYARSEDPSRELDLDDYADAAAELIREKCSDAGAHVLGMSWGGVIATRLALRHPELVRSLVLGASTVGSGADATAPQPCDRGSSIWAAAGLRTSPSAARHGCCPRTHPTTSSSARPES